MSRSPASGIPAGGPGVGPASGRPALGEELRPWEPGNWLSLRHGAQSPRILAPLAEAKEAELKELNPYLSEPQYRDELRSLAFAEAELAIRRAWHNEHGLITADGKDVAGIDRLERAEARAMKLRERCGLTPSSSLKFLATWMGALKEHERDDLFEEMKRRGRAIADAQVRPLPAAPADTSTATTGTDHDVEQ